MLTKALTQAIQQERDRVEKMILKQIAIHKQLESEYVGGIKEIIHGIKSNNSHTFVIEQLQDLLNKIKKQKIFLNKKFLFLVR